MTNDIVIEVPEGYAVCPGCNGSKTVNNRDCVNCSPCGMFVDRTPKGYTRPRTDNGLGCTHEFRGTTLGRNYTKYQCLHCITSYSVDSGD